MKLSEKRGPAPTVDEDETAVETELSALIRAHVHDTTTTERVVDFLFALDDLIALQRGEQDGAGHDQRLLVLLADTLPILDVREDVLVGLEILLLL